MDQPRPPVLRALVVDDVAENRALASAMLEAWDVKVDEAEDGSVGLASLSERRYDFILLDISMPNIDGVEICRQIKNSESLGATYVVAYTAHAFASEHKRILGAGFDALLIKPITIEDMEKAINPILTSHAKKIEKFESGLV